MPSPILLMPLALGFVLFSAEAALPFSGSQIVFLSEISHLAPSERRADSPEFLSRWAWIGKVRFSFFFIVLN